jgi:hypothetical protein
MSEFADCADAAEVEVVNGIGVDVRRKGKRIADKTVFELGDEFGFPA